MRCPQCGCNNQDTSAFCEQCGSILNLTEYTSEQYEYHAPSPPPLNGHKVLPLTPLPLPSAPLSEHSAFETQSQLLVDQKIISRPGLGIFSAILYFMGLLIAALGWIGTIVNFGTSTRISSLAFLSGIILIIIGTVFFTRIRNRYSILRWWQRIFWIAAATIVGFIALAIGISFLENANASSVLTGCMIFLYGLVWAIFAVW